MRKNLLLLTCCLIIYPLQFAAKPSIPPPPIHVEDGWDKNEDGDRSFSSSPSLFKDANFVYVYSEKQLDNLTIGITDMQGNTYHYEVTTLPDGCCFETLWIYRNRIKLQQKYCRHLC